MARDIERFVRIQKPSPVTKASSGDGWRTLPNCEKLAVWEVGTAQRLDDGNGSGITLHIFHIPHVPNITRGYRVIYLGQRFSITEVSNSPKLLGLELRCEAIA